MPGPDLYSKIQALCETFASMNQISPSNPYTPSLTSNILALRTPDALHSWGHNYLVSQTPSTQGKMDNKAFQHHLDSSLPLFETMRTQVHDIVVDEKNMKAVIRMSYFLRPHGSELTIENDLVWILKVKELDDGEVKMSGSIEFIDPVAGQLLGAEIRKGIGEDAVKSGAAAM